MAAQATAALGVEAVQCCAKTQHCGELTLCWELSAGPREWPQECPECAAVPSAPELSTAPTS